MSGDVKSSILIACHQTPWRASSWLDKSQNVERICELAVGKWPSGNWELRLLSAWFLRIAQVSFVNFALGTWCLTWNLTMTWKRNKHARQQLGAWQFCSLQPSHLTIWRTACTCCPLCGNTSRNGTENNKFCRKGKGFLPCLGHRKFQGQIFSCLARLFKNGIVVVEGSTVNIFFQFVQSILLCHSTSKFWKPTIVLARSHFDLVFRLAVPDKSQSTFLAYYKIRSFGGAVFAEGPMEETLLVIVTDIRLESRYVPFSSIAMFD